MQSNNSMVQKMKLSETVVDLDSRRIKKQEDERDQSLKNAAGAIENMKDDFNVVIDSTIEALQRSGMSEDNAVKVIVTHLSDLVMSHDLQESSP